MARTIDIAAIAGLLGYTPGETRSIMSIHISGTEHRVYVDRRIQSHRGANPIPTAYQTDRNGQSLLFTESFPYDSPDLDVDPEYKVLSRAAVQAIYDATE